MQINIVFKLTVAEAPFSGGWVERHNLNIADMLDKVLEESNIDINLTLLWCINAKNSLANLHGFSPFQLAVEQHLKLPSTLIDKPPSSIQAITSKILRNNLTALHRGSEAFIASENSEKISWALNHYVRNSGGIKHINWDGSF